MKFRIVKHIVFAFIWIPTAQAQNGMPVSSVKLSSITTHYWTDLLNLNPLMATEYGMYDHNDEMEISISDAHFKKSIILNKRYLDSLKNINFNQLQEQDLAVLCRLPF